MTEIGVRRYIRWRTKRSSVLEAKFLADPAWDILLELFASFLAQRRVSVTNLCGAVGVPATTALRWIKVLETEGLLMRADDPLDGRRSFIALSAAGETKMTNFFNANPLSHPI